MLTPEILLDFVRKNAQMQFITYSERKPFSAVKDGHRILITPESTDEERKTTPAELEKFCTKYNDSMSLRPVDYRKVTQNSSYLIAILRQVLSAVPMKQVWKIAPGDNCSDWNVFLSNRCIGIGWLPARDYTEFESSRDVLSALEEIHGVGAPGFGKRSAGIVMAFANEISVGDIIVANDGRNRMIGIGLVNSEYIAPNNKENPLKSDKTTHRHHVRLIDWLITKPVDLTPAPPRKYFFSIPTVHKVSVSRVDEILDNYQSTYPNDSTLFDSLVELFDVEIPDSTPKAIDLKPTTTRVQTTTYRILRDTRVALRVKQMHNFECQICGTTIELPNGKRYAEAHHIRPLGGEHNGKDLEENVLCLCPNHHAECDYGVIRLDTSDLSVVAGHQINSANISYHNEIIFGHGQ